MSDPREIELKLECEPSDLATLQDHPLLRDAAEQGEAELASVYFDTSDRLLLAAKLGLRVRESGGRFVQTLKAEGDGLFDRPEWEHPVERSEPDRAALADTPFARHVAADAALEPLFITRVTRRTYLVEQGGSRIEVALDTGRIEAPAAGDRIVPICEVELELKDGTASDLFALAQAIANLVPVRIGVRSKAERGYALATGKLDKVRKAEPVPLREDMTAADAFRSVAHACLRQMRINEDILLRGRDADALHQMRVAIRRLRSAFSLFGDLVDDPLGVRIRTELKEVTEPLGRARNLDVFLATILPAERERHPDETGLLGLERQLEDERAKAYRDIAALLESDAWRMLLLDLVGWINAGPWLREKRPGRTALREEPARVFAARELDRRRRQVKRRGRHLDDLEPEERHRVRIAAKKLRYGAEFFAALFPGKKAAKRHSAFGKALSDLQDHLGALNDIATGHELMRDLTDEPAGASTLFAAGMTAADIEARSRMLLEAAAEAHEELVDTKPFWR
ncbi:MAG TPA: CHAD domain-containing protein [Methylobacterium sp.]|jgi:inorganic triphosphatase YgiF|uniref:CYTH and CHAD domain-containing protein n=1 Tax=Methylorubrum sp. B1-46 TaxID=2897334 RepID=UPI001E419859|nr:CYTH and CHAD domain-containing protein [Methylorubrum sp. B1-46]UGB24329.1 CHAD domain-containing protein [Methylorubrum sp. B1-46]HEV2543882.1 CHAD domain-containing protein [Methylobacterium sp.]